MARKQSGLGKGLEALFADNSQDEQRVEMIRIEDVEPNRSQPRKNFDGAALEELAESVRQHGVLQPIIARPEIGGGYVIVAGERRWRAARIAGLTEVPVSVFKRVIVFIEFINYETDYVSDLTIAINIHFIINIAEKTVVEFFEFLINFFSVGLVGFKETEHNNYSFNTGMICVLELKCCLISSDKGVSVIKTSTLSNGIDMYGEVE